MSSPTTTSASSAKEDVKTSTSATGAPIVTETKNDGNTDQPTMPDEGSGGKSHSKITFVPDSCRCSGSHPHHSHGDPDADGYQVDTDSEYSSDELPTNPSEGEQWLAGLREREKAKQAAEQASGVQPSEVQDEAATGEKK